MITYKTHCQATSILVLLLCNDPPPNNVWLRIVQQPMDYSYMYKSLKCTKVYLQQTNILLYDAYVYKDSFHISCMRSKGNMSSVAKPTGVQISSLIISHCIAAGDTPDLFSWTSLFFFLRNRLVGTSSTDFWSSFIFSNVFTVSVCDGLWNRFNLFCGVLADLFSAMISACPLWANWLVLLWPFQI